MDIFGIPIQAFLGQLLLGPRQRLVLRDAEPGPGGDLRPARDRQLRARRALHDRRLRGLRRVDTLRHQLLVRADHRAAGRRRARRRHRAHLLLKHLYKHRSDLRPAADLRPGAADRRGRVPLRCSASPASPIRCPKLLQGATNLGFMVLPNYRAWVVVASLPVCLGTWFVIERTRLGAYLRAGTENPSPGAGLRHQRADAGDADLRAAVPRWRPWPGCSPRRSSR